MHEIGERGAVRSCDGEHLFVARHWRVVADRPATREKNESAEAESRHAKQHRHASTPKTV
jgi:ribosomal protein S21